MISARPPGRPRAPAPKRLTPDRLARIAPQTRTTPSSNSVMRAEPPNAAHSTNRPQRPPQPQQPGQTVESRNARRTHDRIVRTTLRTYPIARLAPAMRAPHVLPRSPTRPFRTAPTNLLTLRTGGTVGHGSSAKVHVKVPLRQLCARDSVGPNDAVVDDGSAHSIHHAHSIRMMQPGLHEHPVSRDATMYSRQRTTCNAQTSKSS